VVIIGAYAIRPTKTQGKHTLGKQNEMRREERRQREEKIRLHFIFWHARVFIAVTAQGGGA
jgi:hypothetical protein